MSKKLRRRIPILYPTPKITVRNSIEGKAEIVIEGEKLAVTVMLDEVDMRHIVLGIREAFAKIKWSRDQANLHNQETLEGR